ncbi:hypothetical protein JT06_00040 [Desulfobulbus sp. Tol-SR]|nr:hypothetical protein JT06_00040 [Desulfobulbus sp. Tol-SR]
MHGQKHVKKLYQSAKKSQKKQFGILSSAAVGENIVVVPRLNPALKASAPPRRPAVRAESRI